MTKMTMESPVGYQQEADGLCSAKLEYMVMRTIQEVLNRIFRMLKTPRGSAVRLLSFPLASYSIHFCKLGESLGGPNEISQWQLSCLSR